MVTLSVSRKIESSLHHPRRLLESLALRRGLSQVRMLGRVVKRFEKFIYSHQAAEWPNAFRHNIDAGPLRFPVRMLGSHALNGAGHQRHAVLGLQIRI